ncbi:hypothetical protein [Brenneria tiliae]|uniref:Uncharacterized protein n=1 Tax=Brenneria tiliae TaxID=2914984 RepID=A0ABT0MPE6_9GAMM|nr:hypothetical protein [Brenneria tiliae]MCL2891710.1 hypothetical protein [Brenneria tiliae]MCL2898266.1 hypothetical protein [Brenneria tiliae]MCL2902616.1 hypothetical protein [Brenneria tiliae]
MSELMDDRRSKQSGKEHQDVLVEKIIENQRLDIAVKEKEQEARVKEIESNERLGLRAIEAQEKVQTALGKRETTNISIRVGGFVLCFFAILIFIGFAIKNDAKDIVIELMKYIVPLVIGGVGGFYLGKSKGKEESEKD